MGVAYLFVCTRALVKRQIDSREFLVDVCGCNVCINPTLTPGLKYEGAPGLYAGVVLCVCVCVCVCALCLPLLCVNCQCCDTILPCSYPPGS